MKTEDKARFESTVPIFGEQRRIRRQQLQVAGIGALIGPLVALSLRRQTFLVRVLCGIAFLPGGIIIGNFVGQQLFPSVADNAETRLVKRLWWAKQCSAGWKYDVSKFPSDWQATHPHLPLAQLPAK